MRRRDFIAVVGGAAAAWPLVARAQQRAVPVVGLLAPGSLERGCEDMIAFRRGLQEAAMWKPARNVTIEYRCR
jgi:putative ABC transport system substrate-binding protein